MPKFIKLTEYASGVDVWVNVNTIFSFHRPQGVDRTTLQTTVARENVRETPQEILEVIAPDALR
jgi:hypothetical protein